MTLLYILAGAGLLVALAAARNYLLFRKRGYRIYRHNRDQWVYEEITQGGKEKLVLDGEMLSRGSVLYVPDENVWRVTVPTWARDRRDEILGRVTALGHGDLELNGTPR